MKICICGLWHLGLVSAAGAATAFETVAFDVDAASIERIARGQLPVFEPGLDGLIGAGVSAGRLRFSADPADALAGAHIVLVTWDTPVDDDDVPDVAFVLDRVRRLYEYLPGDATLLISSQVPVGFCRTIETELAARGIRTGVAYSPENLRLGTALEAFRSADRVVIGTRTERDRHRLERLFEPFTAQVVAMSVESAEMTKHALNAFLATSLTFLYEIAALCERVGADVADVERALRADPRVGRRAYVSAGPGFSGGTLGRDVATLNGLSERERLTSPLLASILQSNEMHRSWALRRLTERLENLSGAVVAILGLTYKPNTNTLRRSASIELASALARLGVTVKAYDPVVRELPENLRGAFELCDCVESALRGADAVVVATEWDEFRGIDARMLLETMRRPLVLDLKRVLDNAVREDARFDYNAIGLPERADA